MLMDISVKGIMDTLTDDVLAMLGEHFEIPSSIVESVRALLCEHTKKATVPLPYVGNIQTHLCKAIRVNHGLFTQCQNQPANGFYCNTCVKRVKNGQPEHGNIHSRGEDAWSSPSGRTPVPYPHVLAKLGISPEVARQQAQYVGINIEKHLYESVKAKRGRPARVKKKLHKASGNSIIKRLLELAIAEPEDMMAVVNDAKY